MRTVAACSLLGILAPTIVFGSILETSASVPMTPGNWDERVYIEAFNPEWGQLEAVYFNVEGQFNGWVRHENRSGAYAEYSDHMDRFLYVTMTLTAHSDALISFDDSVNLTGELMPYDGIDDFDGLSGVSHQVYTPITGGIAIPRLEAVDFIGQHMLEVRLVSRSAVEVSLSRSGGISEGESTCSATINVTYQFAPAAVINEDATWGEVKTLYH